jgi:hypothetical protein
VFLRSASPDAVATAENGGDGRVLFLSSLSRLCSVMFRLNGEQNEEREKGEQSRRREAKERKKSRKKKKKKKP